MHFSCPRSLPLVVPNIMNSFELDNLCYTYDGTKVCCSSALLAGLPRSRVSIGGRAFAVSSPKMVVGQDDPDSTASALYLPSSIDSIGPKCSDLSRNMSTVTFDAHSRRSCLMDCARGHCHSVARYGYRENGMRGPSCAESKRGLQLIETSIMSRDENQGVLRDARRSSWQKTRM
jgi:hypothetical protein